MTTTMSGFTDVGVGVALRPGLRLRRTRWRCRGCARDRNVVHGARGPGHALAGRRETRHEVRRGVPRPNETKGVVIVPRRVPRHVTL
jgi:hypothetical protein